MLNSLEELCITRVTIGYSSQDCLTPKGGAYIYIINIIKSCR